MLNSFSEILHCLTYPGNKLNLQSSWFIRTGRCFWPISHQVRFPRNLARVLSRPLRTGCVFVLQIFRMSVIFLKLLVGHECFHTEPEHHAAKKRPFYFSHYIVDFSELSQCKQRHQPITVFVWNGHHVHLPQQHLKSQSQPNIATSV